ncbi:helix-turn-helix domain-containing protein [Pseudomonas aeruginosa]|uniref:helix-turn-helix domain-containing protein n=1 Tax=Pseudomonas aeruginosa TaxID=287 RepID=UPI001A32FD6E|nr:helix-turn-helix transcriptional regulator [Pseudomonas aeruginosa]HCF9884518.1 helix-turn-helix transcriptional regulator [Pseudomonas aeruginosa]
MELFVSIGARLRQERERIGLSQTEFAAIADKAGVAGATRQSQSLYEKGKRMPDAGYLAVVAAAGVDVSYVLTGQRQGGVASAPTQEQDSPLTHEERALLENFRHCSPDTRAAIKATSDALARRPKKKTG